MKLTELVSLDLGHLQHLHLADEHVLKRVDLAALGLDLLADGLSNELGDEALKVTLGGLSGDDVPHLLADLADLGALGVAGLLHLSGPLAGEADSELKSVWVRQTKANSSIATYDAHVVAVGGLDLDVSLDESLPLADQRAQLVAGHIHAVEVGQDTLALDVLSDELHVAETLLGVLVQVTEGDIEHTASELGSLGP